MKKDEWPWFVLFLPFIWLAALIAAVVQLLAGKLGMLALALFALLVVPAFACDKGCTEYQGTCACDAKPAEGAPVVDASAFTSDEKPSHHPEPAWQRGDVKVIEIPSFKSESEEADAQIKFAQSGKPAK